MADRTVSELLTLGREIWGEQRLTLQQIAVRLQVTVGDIARAARTEDEGQEINRAEVGKELGNLILSCIRWCDDVGIEPDLALVLATVAQRHYARQLGGGDG